MSHWSFQPIFSSYAVVLGLAVALTLLLLIGPSFHSVGRWRRITLVAIRLAVIGLLLLAMLRPTHVSTTHTPQSATLVILADQTRSMRLPHGIDQTSRWQALNAALRSSSPALRKLTELLEVKLYTFDSALHELTVADDLIQLPELPSGEQTDIGTTLNEALQRELGKRLAGVIVLSDGRQTAFDPRVDIQEAGREVGRLGFPLYAVPFGPAGATAHGRDVIVEQLPDEYTVFVKSELAVQGAIRIRGYVNQDVPVELLVKHVDSGREETIGPVNIRARSDGELVPVALTYTPQQAGRYRLVLQAENQPGELITANNRLTAYLRVLEGGINAFYVYGSLIGEQLRLRHSLGQSPDINLQRRFIHPKADWPLSLDVAPNDFDVLIVEDVDSAALTAEAWQEIADAVEGGKGLIMIGGYQSFGPGGFQRTPLADVLPVEMGRFERQELGPNKTISRDLHLWGNQRIVPTRPHMVTRLAGEAENETAWQNLPPLTGANRFASLKPRSQVLAESHEGVPLLVAGEYGQGRVLAFAGNTTWRWWKDHEQQHKRFWRQTVLWLAKRDDLAEDEVWLRLDRRRYPIHDRITFAAGARSPSGDPLAEATLTATLSDPAGQTSPVQLSRDGDQLIGSIESADVAGDYTIAVSAELNGRPLGTARDDFVVFDHDVELSNPAADHDQLARLAEYSQDEGGRMVAPEDLPELISEIHRRPPQLEMEIETRWQFADSPSSAWPFFLCLVGMLTAEWFCRKRWGLV